MARSLHSQMMEQLALRDGQRAFLKSVNLSLGKFLKIQPQEVAFLDLSNPRVVYGAVPPLAAALIAN